MIADLRDSIQANQSLAIKALAKPSQQAGGNSWLIGKSRSVADGGELALQLVYPNNAHQMPHGAEVSTKTGSTDRFPAGHSLSSTRPDSSSPPSGPPAAAQR